MCSFTYSRCQLIVLIRISQVAALRKSLGKDLEFGESHSHLSRGSCQLMTFHIRHSICRRTACVGTCRPDRARCPLGCIRGTRGVCIVRGPRAQTAGLVEERSDSHAHRRTRREPRTSPRYFEDATFRGGSSIGCHNENVMISRGWIFRLLRAFLNCRGSSDSGEASQAHKVSLHSRFDPDFRALVPIGSQGAAMAALLAALVRRYFFFFLGGEPQRTNS